MRFISTRSTELGSLAALLLMLAPALLIADEADQVPTRAVRPTETPSADAGMWEVDDFFGEADRTPAATPEADAPFEASAEPEAPSEIVSPIAVRVKPTEESVSDIVRPTPDPDIAPLEAAGPVDENSNTSESTPSATNTDEQTAADPPAEDQPLEPIPDPRTSGAVEVEPASFNGVVPGVSTSEDVDKAWGAPTEIRKQGDLLIHAYEMAAFERIEVSYRKDKVFSIVVRLSREFPADVVAEQLELTAIHPVLISDELGNILGQSYPERGVLFAFTPAEEPGKATMKVAEVILESISPEAFVLRAETYLEKRVEASLRDLDEALRRDPSNARAHWLQSRVLLTLDRVEEAIEAGGRAVELQGENARYRIAKAESLARAGRLAEAIEETKLAIRGSEQRPHVAAQAFCLLGDLFSSGANPNYKEAVRYHMQALKIANALADNPHPAVHRLAKKVLLDAHLGAAHNIAWGEWREKQRAVEKWLERAEAFAEELAGDKPVAQTHRLRIDARALSACVGLQGQMDPTRWADDAVEVGRELIDAADDPLRKGQLQRELGTILYDALQVYQMRGDNQTALQYGEAAIEYLEAGHQQKPTAAGSYMLGRACFRLGAIRDLADEDHAAAVAWFDKATPYLEQPLPGSAAHELGRHGETFVSMAVSYWEVDQKQKALELTKIGTVLMQRAVKSGTLTNTALQIPYGNLAAMHRQLGRDDDAAKFERMAAGATDTTIR